MTRLLTALALLCAAAVAFAGPGFDDAFWGEPIAVLDNDPVGLGVPEANVYVTGVDGAIAAENIFYAQIPSSVVNGWIADPTTNYGLAVIGRAPNYYTNNCWATPFMTWQWMARPMIKMDGEWWSFADEAAWIKEEDPNFMMVSGDSAQGPEYNSQFCLAPNGHNVMLARWFSNLSGNVPGETTTLRWGAPWWVDNNAEFDVYLAPRYWDQGWITYGDYVGDVVPQQAGDANADGLVNDADLAILLANWAGDPKVWGQGNFNTDTAVNDADLAILLANWGFGVAVPEPASLGLLVLGGLGLIRRRR